MLSQNCRAHVNTRVQAVPDFRTPNPHFSYTAREHIFRGVAQWCSKTEPRTVFCAGKADPGGRSLAEIPGSNPAVGMDICHVVCCQVEVSETGRSLVQGECYRLWCVLRRGSHQATLHATRQIS